MLDLIVKNGVVVTPGGAGEFENPPVILKLNREDGSIDDKILVGQGDVMLKNLVINGRREDKLSVRRDAACRRRSPTASCAARHRRSWRGHRR